ncbi:protein EI24 homolog [Oryza brachyantha]|uniref:Protein EI24 homolog n=1 Tax=Oryza brachyantha TaxID=4533 RepID=J3LY08_ORYBR|nr:protein EI24 homolog [Oryza brachyantha]
MAPSLASQAKPAAVLWLAGFLQAARLHRVVSFCASSRPLSVRIAQCFLLNGFIFLGSLLTLKSVVIPMLSWILPEECSQLQGQHLCGHTVAVATYSFLRSVLIQIFYVFWFYPLYIFSFILSTLWYNDIAKHALDVVKSKSLDATKALDAHTISESTERPEGFDGVAIGIGEQVYSILLLTIFFIEVSVIGYVPYFGKAINFLLLSLMYAYYCFEYKWNFFAVSLNERLDFFESNWAFFAGFGSPCVLPIFFFSPLASYGVMAILYPLFVLTAAGTQAERVIDQLKPSHGGKLQRIPVFFVAKRLTTQVLQLFPEVQKEQ